MRLVSVSLKCKSIHLVMRALCVVWLWKQSVRGSQWRYGGSIDDAIDKWLVRKGDGTRIFFVGTQRKNGFDWRSQVDHTARKAKRTLALLRRFCYTWKTPVKIQLNQFGRGEDRLCVCLGPFTQYHHTTSCAELAGIPRFDVHEMISQEKWAQLDDLLQQWWTICNAINITWSELRVYTEKNNCNMRGLPLDRFTLNIEWKRPSKSTLTILCRKRSSLNENLV